MGFLSGSLACTRFNIVSMPESPNFELAAFRLIQPGSNITESSGFVPFEIDEPYDWGAQRFAFRVRMDKINIDSTLVKERLRELIKGELDRGERLGPKKKKKLKELAEEEILAQSAPRSKVIEAVIDGSLLYVGSTSKSHLGNVLALLQKVGVEVEYKTPWLERGWEEEPSELVDLKEPGQSLFGCRFLKELLNEEEFFVEPEKGSIKLATHTHAKVTLTGEVLGELDRYIEEGAELLSAKLIFGELPFSFDALAYRLNGLKLQNVKGEHWTETLDERLDMLKGVWETLDEKFTALMADGTPAVPPLTITTAPSTADEQAQSAEETEMAEDRSADEADAATPEGEAVLASE
ncbi:Recombination-associated protein RdgC [Sulfidibacter corallicola]|uniref:Recombination-associated protein RdgC n=1 Tax=Sulfidibacter corallicola TaxID=2818388 RepID=A0A8A4TVR8_SULCO|nr:recombination-associated protein RdgC [Sulfidibacter corallicola]QTD53224.1 recombination-associated protein RdgC [Sulfidibacter corallicola]